MHETCTVGLDLARSEFAARIDAAKAQTVIEIMKVDAQVERLKGELRETRAAINARLDERSDGIDQFSRQQDLQSSRVHDLLNDLYDVLGDLYGVLGERQPRDAFNMSPVGRMMAL